MSQRFLVHVHRTDKVGTCFWLTEDSTLTTDVTLAHEFTDRAASTRAVLDMINCEAEKLGEFAGAISFEAYEHPVEAAELPASIRTTMGMH